MFYEIENISENILHIQSKLGSIPWNTVSPT